LVIVWHLLSDPEARFHDLGPDFYDNRIGRAANSRGWGITVIAILQDRPQLTITWGFPDTPGACHGCALRLVTVSERPTADDRAKALNLLPTDH
jgi:hypothetical protein